MLIIAIVTAVAALLVLVGKTQERVNARREAKARQALAARHGVSNVVVYDPHAANKRVYLV